MSTALDKEGFGPWALVTGASSGIGKEFARQIAASGINIVLVARREGLLKEVGVEFSKRYGVEHRVVVLDVSREDFIGQLASATDDLDIGLVVSNAGTGNPGEFLKLDRQLHQATLRVSTMAHLDITHHFGAKLAKRRRGGLIPAGAMGAGFFGKGLAEHFVICGSFFTLGRDSGMRRAVFPAAMARRLMASMLAKTLATADR